MRRTYIIIITAALLSGCQAIGGSRAMNEAAFANTWKLYTHCRSETDAIQMWQDAQQLHRTVRLMDHFSRSARLLPDTIERSLAEPPPRLAVDPKAMAAACALSAAQAAQNAGHSGFAGEMFSFVVANFAQPRYAYYREQAQIGLGQLEGNVTEQIAMTFDRQPPPPH